MLISLSVWTAPLHLKVLILRLESFQSPMGHWIIHLETTLPNEALLFRLQFENAKFFDCIAISAPAPQKKSAWCNVKVFWWYDHKACESENKVSRPNFWSALHSCIISRPWFSVSDIQYAMQITILYLGRCLDLPRYPDNKVERKNFLFAVRSHALFGRPLASLLPL